MSQTRNGSQSEMKIIHSAIHSQGENFTWTPIMQKLGLLSLHIHLFFLFILNRYSLFNSKMILKYELNMENTATLQNNKLTDENKFSFNIFKGRQLTTNVKAKQYQTEVTLKLLYLINC